MTILTLIHCGSATAAIASLVALLALAGHMVHAKVNKRPEEAVHHKEFLSMPMIWDWG